MHGTVISAPNVPIPETKYKRSKNIFPVTYIALICGCVWLQLLKSLAQSPIGSPGTLGTGDSDLEPVSPLNRAKSGKIGHFQTFEV